MGELLQGFPERSTAHAEALDEFDLAQPLAFWQPIAQNIVAQLIGNLLAKAKNELVPHPLIDFLYLPANGPASIKPD